MFSCFSFMFSLPTDFFTFLFNIIDRYLHKIIMLFMLLFLTSYKSAKKTEKKEWKTNKLNLLSMGEERYGIRREQRMKVIKVLEII